MIEDGSDFLTDHAYPLAKLAWPDGFDPEVHPGENIAVVRHEASMQGVTLT